MELIEPFSARWKHKYLTSGENFINGHNNQQVKDGIVVQISDDFKTRVA